MSQGKISVISSELKLDVIQSFRSRETVANIGRALGPEPTTVKTICHSNTNTMARNYLLIKMECPLPISISDQNWQWISLSKDVIKNKAIYIYL